MSVRTAQDKVGQGSQDRRDRKCQLEQLRTKRDRAAAGQKNQDRTERKCYILTAGQGSQDRAQRNCVVNQKQN